MKLLVRILLLMFVSSLARVPDARCQNVTNNSQNEQQPAKTKIVEDAPPAESNQGNAPAKQDGDRGYTVEVKKLPKKDAWDKIYIVLTGCLVGVGIGTLITIWIQAIETKRAAKATQESARATQDSVEVQKAAYRQWLKVENWRAGEPKFVEGAELGLVNIQFDILNPTNFPLTIRRITTQIQGLSALPPMNFYFPTGRRIAPNDRYLHGAQVSFERREMKDYLEGRGKLFTIIGVFTGFEDVLGDWQEDSCGRYCWFSKLDGASFEPYEPGELPETDPKNEGQEAN